MEGSLFSLFVYVPVITVLLIALIATVIYRLMREMTNPESSSTFVVTTLLVIGAILSYGALIATLFFWTQGWLG